MGDSACLMHAFSYASALPINEAKQLRQKEAASALSSCYAQGPGKDPTTRVYCTQSYLPILQEAFSKARTRDLQVTWQELYQLLQGSSSPSSSANLQIFTKEQSHQRGNHMRSLGESVSLGRFTTESLAWEKWSTFPHKRYVEEAERYAQPGSVAQKKAFFEAHYKKIAAQKAAAAALLEQANTQQDPNVNTSVQGVADVKEKENGSPLTRVASSKEPQETISGSELSETSHTEKPLLKSSSSKQDDDVTTAMSKKRSALSSFKSSVNSMKSKIPSSPARHNNLRHVNKENNFTPNRKNPTSAFANEKKSTSKSLSKVMNFTPAKEPDKVPPPPPPTTLTKKSSKMAPNAAKKCITPPKTPAATSDGAAKRSLTTPSSENRRMETPVHPAASGSQTAGPKWSILSAVCAKSLTACRNKLQSPSLSTPIILRTEERAARRKQKLEEKFNAKEVQKVQLPTKLKEKAEVELRKLRQSFCFRARPLPKFYKERETSRNHTKKTPVKRPQSPKLGRIPSNREMKGLASQPLSAYLTKNGSCKYSGKKNCPKSVNSRTLPTVVSHDQNATSD